MSRISLSQSRHRSPRPRHGMVLVVVLVVVSLLALAALTFSQLMLAEREATELTGRRLAARALAESGVDYARYMLMQDELTLAELGGIYDNMYELSGYLVVDDLNLRKRGRFSIISPNMDTGYYSGVRYGLEDESTKLNINVVAEYEAQEEGTGQAMLLMLPGMTDEIADAILDWIDADDEMREFGAEADHYSTLVPGYAPKNGPLDSIDELLLVEGVTPWLLYGVDGNRNNHADSMEPDSQSLMDVDNSDGSASSGWAPYITVHSFESNTTEEGETKIDLNQDDLETLYDEVSEALSADWATFIVGFRQNGGSEPANDAVAPSSVQKDTINFEGEAAQEISSVLDLVGVGTQVSTQGNNPQGGDTTTLAPMIEEGSYDDLPTLLDAVTTVSSDDDTISGRININQASRTVLLTIPGMTEEAADQILYNRIEDPIEADEDQMYTVWPLIQGAVDLETMKSVERYICTGGAVYRAQIVGYYDAGGPFARLEVLFDATQSPPAVLSWNDMGHLGQGYPLEMLGLE